MINDETLESQEDVAATHTTGPWGVDFDEATNVRSPDGGYVCQLGYLRGKFGRLGRKTSEEVSANAHLIAASPDMLATLKALADAIDTVPEQPIGVWWGAIHAAIAKAEPRS